MLIESFPNPYPKPSFQFPVLPPTVDPDAAPVHSVSVNCQWLPYIRGALTQLCLQSTWKSDDPAVVELAQVRAATLISMFDECSGGSGLPFACGGPLQTTSQPWGVWTIGHLGVYVGGSGYVNTCCFFDSNHHYSGIYLSIAFSSPITFSNVHLVYDLQIGENGDPLDNCIDVYDFTGGTGTVGTPLHFNQAHNGPGQVYDSGPHSAPISTLGIFCGCAIGINHDPSPQGSFVLERVDISGTAAVPPC